MDPSHYAPPQAPVADTPTPKVSSRASLFAAVAMVGVTVLFELGKMVRMYLAPRGATPYWVYLTMSLEFVLLASVSILLYKRQGWARWLLIALTGWRLFLIVVTFTTLLRLAGQNFVDLPWTVFAQWLIEPVLLVSGVVLVFGPARHWFRDQT